MSSPKPSMAATFLMPTPFFLLSLLLLFRRHAAVLFVPRAVCAMAHNTTAGAGKTTLLNALGGRATYGQVSGFVTLGGRPLTSQDLNYVPQFDDHNERFTPREILTYMKHLQVKVMRRREAGRQLHVYIR